MQCLATFATTHMALWFEKICREQGHAVRIVPVPRQLSASCGLACEYPCPSRAAIEQLAENKKIEVESYHELT